MAGCFKWRHPCLIAGLWKVRLKASPGSINAKLGGNSRNNQSMGDSESMVHAVPSA